MATPTIHPITHPQAREDALTFLHHGMPIIVPTDTVYGIGAAALNPTAILRIYACKQRPLTQALPMLLGDIADLARVTHTITPLVQQLAQLWPGALTLVVPAAPHLPPELLAHGNTVAVRIPNHPWLRDLIRSHGTPLAMTSANLHGNHDPQTLAQSIVQIGDTIPLAIDGGATPGPVPSTIVDCTGPIPQLLRQGVLPWEHILTTTRISHTEVQDRPPWDPAPRRT